MLKNICYIVSLLSVFSLDLYGTANGQEENGPNKIPIIRNGDMPPLPRSNTFAELNIKKMIQNKQNTENKNIKPISSFEDCISVAKDKITTLQSNTAIKALYVRNDKLFFDINTQDSKQKIQGDFAIALDNYHKLTIALDAEMQLLSINSQQWNEKLNNFNAYESTHEIAEDELLTNVEWSQKEKSSDTNFNIVKLYFKHENGTWSGTVKYKKGTNGKTCGYVLIEYIDNDSTRYYSGSVTNFYGDEKAHNQSMELFYNKFIDIASKMNDYTKKASESSEYCNTLNSDLKKTWKQSQAKLGSTNTSMPLALVGLEIIDKCPFKLESQIQINSTIKNTLHKTLNISIDIDKPADTIQKELEEQITSIVANKVEDKTKEITLTNEKKLNEAKTKTDDLEKQLNEVREQLKQEKTKVNNLNKQLNEKQNYCKNVWTNHTHMCNSIDKICQDDCNINISDVTLKDKIKTIKDKIQQLKKDYEMCLTINGTLNNNADKSVKQLEVYKRISRKLNDALSSIYKNGTIDTQKIMQTYKDIQSLVHNNSNIINGIPFKIPTSSSIKTN